MYVHVIVVCVFFVLLRNTVEKFETFFVPLRGRLHVCFARLFFMSDKLFVADVCVFRVNRD